MKCPKCNVETEPVDVKSIQLDRCPHCLGTWFDHGELRLLREKETHTDYRWSEMDLWRDPGQLRVTEESECRCPNDGASLAIVRYVDSDVVVEVCPSCYGIWVDRQEFNRLLAYLRESTDAESLPELLVDVKDEFADLFTGKNGVKAELSDMGKTLYLLQLRFAVEHPALVKLKEAIRHLIPE